MRAVPHAMLPFLRILCCCRLPLHAGLMACWQLPRLGQEKAIPRAISTQLHAPRLLTALQRIAPSISATFVSPRWVIFLHYTLF